MSSLKFIHTEVSSKDCHKQRLVTDKFTMHASNVVLTVKVPRNNEQDW